ncbi:MAG: hypothetical protein K2K39_01400 [Clostridia bacterium]|nr:hypothetical protein [Clostridia bacterium]
MDIITLYAKGVIGEIMIHSMSGGVISEYDNLIYVFVEIEDGIDKGVKRWYISPFIMVKAGDKVEVEVGGKLSRGQVLRVENVTKQTAPFPVNRTREIERIL